MTDAGHRPFIARDAAALRSAIARAKSAAETGAANRAAADGASAGHAEVSGTTRAVGLVPTMGALHEGHVALVRASRADNAITVVSIFVNAAQFNNAADLARYPRTEVEDVALLAREGVDIVFAPTADVIYPDGFASSVDVGGVTEVLEGAHRPGHFRGVATVVTLLLQLVRPTRAYFGEKDWQQLLVVQRLAHDLRLGAEIVGVPIVRDTDGLALSSRNVRLDRIARRAACSLSAAIAAVQQLSAAGERRTAVLETQLHATLASEPTVRVEYATIVDASTLLPMERIDRPARVLIAAQVPPRATGERSALDETDPGPVRLIDNGPLP